MSLWETFFMGFVRFFAACRSYASPYFILTVPMNAWGYYLLWENNANGTSHAWHASESTNRRAGAAPNACAVDGMLRHPEKNLEEFEMYRQCSILEMVFS